MTRERGPRCLPVLLQAPGVRFTRTFVSDSLVRTYLARSTDNRVTFPPSIGNGATEPVSGARLPE